MIRRTLLITTLLAAAAPLAADSLPVTEITVFKDGHAMLVHQGRVALSEGTASISGIPAPVMGSFFPFTSEDGLHIARTRTQKVTVEKETSPHSIRQVLESAKGSGVRLRVRGQNEERVIAGNVHDVVDSEQPPLQPNPYFYGGASYVPPRQESLLTLQTNEGLVSFSVNDITEVVLLGGSSGKRRVEEDGYSITFGSRSGTLPDSATAGYAYIQRGIRWMPSYTLRQEGEETILTLQATLVNEIADLDNVTARLAVGVPKIEFEGFHDPMAPTDFAANLSSFFPTGQATSANISNAMMSQMAYSNAARQTGGGGEAAPAGPGVPEDANAELYFFTVENLTLAKGERAVVTLATQRVSTEDLFRLTVPFTPPQSGDSRYGHSQTPESRRLADELAAPKVLRILSFKNAADFPFTTAPVMVFDAQNRLLAQSLLRYTPVGGSAEIELNPALNIPAKVDERQTSQEPNALHLNGSDYIRVTNQGTITLTNRRDKPVKILVRRDVFGKAHESDPEAKVTGSSLAEIRAQRRDGGYDALYYEWPQWLTSLNGFDRLEWEVELPPGEEKVLTASWQYYWR